MPISTRFFRLLLIFTAIFAAGCARYSTSGTDSPGGNGYKLIRAPEETDAMKAWVYELDNGLRVYLTENHEEPRFYAEIPVRAGSKHDPAESTGLAHYLEHLLFKGTDKLGTLDYAAEKPHLDRIRALYEEHFAATDPMTRAQIYEHINREASLAAQYAVPNEYDKIYKAMGARAVNAHTSVEETVYKADMPANRINQWAAVESDRFKSPVFRLFHTELETVYEEKNATLDDKNRIIYEAVNRQLYKVHPYGQQPTIGEVEHLKNPSIANIEKYFSTYYVPNNMAVVISGDIDPEETIVLVAERFSSWQQKPLPEPRQYVDPPINGVERVEVTYPGEEYVMLAFPTASQNSDDAHALMICDMILDNRVAGLININLNQKQAVRSAGSFPQMFNDAGAQYLWGIPKADQTLEEVEKLLLEQLDLVKRGEFPDELIPAIVTDFRKSQMQMLESNEGRVTLMRESFIAGRTWEEQLRELDLLATITKEDVTRVANKYFGNNYVAGYRRDAPHKVPKIEKPKIDKLELDSARQSPYAAQILAMPVEEIEPVFIQKGEDYMDRQLSDGRRLMYVPNPLNNIFSFRIVIDKGTDHDNRLLPAAQLLAKSGAGDLSAEELAMEWYSLGTDFNVDSAPAESTISMAGLDENFEESLMLLRGVLENPTSDEATLAELKSIILTQREDAKKDPNSVANALLVYNRYGERSPYLTMLSTEELKAVTREELYAAIQELLTYRATIEYTGTLPIDEVAKLIERHLPVTGKLKDPPPFPYKRVRETPGTEILFVDKETAQSQVRIESGSINFTEDAMPAILLYNTYFAGGLSGIVYQELRESRGLVYFAGASYLVGERKNDQNLMIGSMGTQADKTSEALAAFINLIDELPQSPERFAEAASSLESRYRTGRIGFRTILGVVRSWERRGLEGNPQPKRFEAIRNAKSEVMNAFWKEQIAGKPKLISIVGPRQRIDMEAISKIGPVREVTVDELFVP